jgi:hypothetical protein
MKKGILSWFKWETATNGAELTADDDCEEEKEKGKEEESRSILTPQLTRRKISDTKKRPKRICGGLKLRLGVNKIPTFYSTEKCPKSATKMPFLMFFTG